MTGLVTRSAVFAVKEEVTEATLIVPTASDFVPLREGYSFEGTVESITSDELVNDIGSSKAFVTKETPAGSLPKYFRHSGTEGVAPEYEILIKSCLGSETINATEYDTIAGSTAGTSAARAKLVVNTGEGAFFAKGQGVLIKDLVNNYRVRNVYTISSDDLNLNFNLPAAPALGVNLGKAIQFSPVGSGHPTFSSWLYQSTTSSGLCEAMAGCRTTSMTMNFTANQLAEINFDFEGVKFYLDPLIVTSSNNKININEGAGELTATITNLVYNNPHALARELETKLDAVAVATITVTYSNTTGKFTIVSNGATFQILWATGTNGSAGTDTHIGTLLGYSDVADDTLAVTYTSDNAITLSPVTPTYDSADSVVVRNSEIVFGSFDEYICRTVNTASITVSTPKTDIDSICSSSGVDSSVINSREVTFNATLIYSAYEAGLFDKFINNTTTSMMINTGVKSGNNWVPGTVVNVYIPNLSLTAFPLGDQDGFFVANLEGTGFVDGNQKDLFINFL